MNREDDNLTVTHDAVATQILDMLWTIKDDLDLLLGDSSANFDVPRDEPYPEVMPTLGVIINSYPEFVMVIAAYSIRTPTPSFHHRVLVGRRELMPSLRYGESRCVSSEDVCSTAGTREGSLC